MSGSLEDLEGRIVDLKEEIRQLEWRIGESVMLPAERSRLKDKLELKKVDLAKLERRHKRNRAC
jgi:hypothetical protein